MQMTEVALEDPVFSSHPLGWRSPAEVASGFALAWALELVERQRLAPGSPESDWAHELLPPRFRYDTLGQLIRLPVSANASTYRRNSIVRLTALAGTWNLFDILNRSWRIEANNSRQFGDLLAYVTGNTDRPSLFGGLSADISKCLLAIRVRRGFQGLEELDLAEQWFVTGDEDLTFQDHRDNTALLFHFTATTPIPLALFSHTFTQTIWSSARLTVKQLGPERVIAENKDRVDLLLDLLQRGAANAERARREMSRPGWLEFNHWPGWG
ncbi:hypothetical protein [Microbacterium sp.]|uniref:hypothetical protein n=1 Tax=Microbacterium sp. TaxID=51671 RepID=UPI003A9351B1